MIRLKNATYIDWETFKFINTDIYIDGDTVLFEAPENYILSDDIDCSGKYVTKSFACGHHHSYTSLARGLPLPKQKTNSYYEILKYKWWELDKTLGLDMIKASAYNTAIECAKNGVTFVIDHHSSPSSIDGSLQTIADAFNEVGVGHLLSYGISDKDGVDIANKALHETKEYLSHNQGLVGLHASFTLTDKTIKKAVKLASSMNTGVHIHVAEDLYDQENCYDIYEKRVVERLADFDVLELQKSIFIHCLYLTHNERVLLRECGAYMVHNIESNLLNNVGDFNSCNLGQNIMLGLDGVHNDMLRAAKASYFYGQQTDTVDLEEIYRRLRQVHSYLQRSDFKGDDSNNLIVLDYKPMTVFNEDTFLEHFMYCIESKHIKHVISNGKLIVNDSVLTTVNESDKKMQSQELSQKLFEKFS